MENGQKNSQKGKQSLATGLNAPDEIKAEEFKNTVLNIKELDSTRTAKLLRRDAEPISLLEALNMESPTAKPLFFHPAPRLKKTLSKPADELATSFKAK